MDTASVGCCWATVEARAARAKARGVSMGRKPKLTEHQKREAIRRREAGETVRDIARSYNVSHSTGNESRHRR